MRFWQSNQFPYFRPFCLISVNISSGKCCYGTSVSWFLRKFFIWPWLWPWPDPFSESRWWVSVSTNLIPPSLSIINIWTNTGRFEFYGPKWPHKMTHNMYLPEYPQCPTSPSENEARSKSIRAECLNVRGRVNSMGTIYESYNMTHLYNLRTHQMFYTCRKGIW